eukprot:Pgem_evm1s1210
MCPYTRYIETIAVPNASAKAVAQHLISKVLLKYGPIKFLATDNAANFLSIKELCLVFQIEKLDCADYHPAQIGRLERIHRSYEIIQQRKSRNDYIENNITEEMLFHKLREFKIDDQLFIKNETYDQGDNTSKKIQRRFDGPMIITKRLGEFTYEMKNPQTEKLLIRNIDKIKEYHERVYNKNSFNYMDNIPFRGETHGFDDIDSNTEIEITEIVDDKQVHVGKNVPETHYKVKTIDIGLIWLNSNNISASQLIEEYLLILLINPNVPV